MFIEVKEIELFLRFCFFKLILHLTYHVDKLAGLRRQIGNNMDIGWTFDKQHPSKTKLNHP
jgi:hypothetical protein